ncbi:arginase family protein [Halalkalicoccus salilacus]|uniref:arginase family protein n=1 Tax=Halalkalicoccus salilacus TaxID=3117459 RepID=UPI00300F18C1
MRATEPDTMWLFIDSDVMEFASCPGTGEPELDGLVSREAIAVVRDAVARLDLDLRVRWCPSGREGPLTPRSMIASRTTPT